jgi:phosphate transport system permease protein
MPQDPDSSRLTVPKSFEFDHALWRKRSIKDIFARYLVGAGGIAVIGSIILIFLFLFAVVFPLFKGAAMHEVTNYPLDKVGDSETLLYSVEEQAEIAMRLDRQGEVSFFYLDTGKLIETKKLIDNDVQLSSWAHLDIEKNIVALGLSNGRVHVFQHEYKSKYNDEQRTIIPSIGYPLGEESIDLEIGKQNLTSLALSENEDGLTIFANTESGPRLINFERQSSFLDEDEFNLELTSQVRLPYIDTPIKALISPEREWLFLLNSNGVIAYYDIRSKDEPIHVEDVTVLSAGRGPTAFEFLIGGISLLLADDNGEIHQLFLVRGSDGVRRLTVIRKFKSGNNRISSVTTEQLRKGFLVTDEKGNISIFHTTADRHVLTENIIDKPLVLLGIAPRSDKIIIEDASRQLHVWELDSEHPEASMSSIWGKVWYESYEKPDYIWQSSSASSDFEPKFSLTPLTFGTFKAAFYAMLFAMPLAICGAIFTAYFMVPKMRAVVKPSIEIMAALPTVILGFLAGLWLAPYVEMNLPGVFTTLILVPLGVFLASYIWWKLPETTTSKVTDGWQAALLIPIVIFFAWLSLVLSPWMEQILFGGNVRLWLTDTMGVGFDQRNALIIGITMGFAVIPIIFSISEDAVFSVPKHLSSGSLALGATPWQTLVRVVLPSASPGIFSATMIGLGRAVGETMIVLMATGNTPVMDFSIFEGMRTLSANVAVELPESEVDSTHYRVLFLASLVLFIFTFFFNTIAEIVRQRLREKYSSL